MLTGKEDGRIVGIQTGEEEGNGLENGTGTASAGVGKR